MISPPETPIPTRRRLVSRDIDGLLDKILTDAYGEDEPLWALLDSVTGALKLPMDVTVVEQPPSLDDGGVTALVGPRRRGRKRAPIGGQAASEARLLAWWLVARTLLDSFDPSAASPGSINLRRDVRPSSGLKSALRIRWRRPFRWRRLHRRPGHFGGQAISVARLQPGGRSPVRTIHRRSNRRSGSHVGRRVARDLAGSDDARRVV